MVVIFSISPENHSIAPGYQATPSQTAVVLRLSQELKHIRITVPFMGCRKKAISHGFEMKRTGFACKIWVPCIAMLRFCFDD